MHPLQSVLIALLARKDYFAQFLDTSLRADRVELFAAIGVGGEV